MGFASNGLTGIDQAGFPGRMPGQQEAESLQLNGQYPADGFQSAATQQQYFFIRMVDQPAVLFRLKKGVADEGRVQWGVGEGGHFKGKYYGQAVEQPGHLEASFGFPGPNLRADVIQQGGFTAGHLPYSAIEQLSGQPEIEAGIVDK